MLMQVDAFNQARFTGKNAAKKAGKPLVFLRIRRSFNMVSYLGVQAFAGESAWHPLAPAAVRGALLCGGGSTNPAP